MKTQGNTFEGFDKVLVFVVALSFFMFFFQSFSLTSHAIEGTTTSNVSISKYLAISFGTNLSGGIQFGTVNSLPATNINATHDYDGASNGTTYTIDVSTDSNSNVDFCTKASSGLTNPALDVIGIENETYASYNLTTASVPDVANEFPFNTTYVKAQDSISPGNSSYWRFWLDIPAAQPSGDYNNTVSFKGVVTGLSC